MCLCHVWPNWATPRNCSRFQPLPVGTIFHIPRKSSQVALRCTVVYASQYRYGCGQQAEMVQCWKCLYYTKSLVDDLPSSLAYWRPMTELSNVVECRKLSDETGVKLPDTVVFLRHRLHQMSKKLIAMRMKMECEIPENLTLFCSSSRLANFRSNDYKLSSN